MTDKAKKIVLANTRVHLTYKSWLDDNLLNLIKEKVADKEIIQWSWCHENGHTDTPYQHTHVFIKTKKLMRSKDTAFFDLFYNKENIHPNVGYVTTVLHERRVLKYHQKEGIKFVQEPEVKSADELRSEFAAKDIFELVDDRAICIKSVSDLKALKDSTRKRPRCESSYTIDDFIREPFKTFECMFIYGGTSLGKTEWAKLHFKNPLLVCNTDDLKLFNGEEHDGIIFDDMSFRHWPIDSCKHLTDWDNHRSIRCRNTDALIPKNTRKIFLSNNEFNEVFPYDPSGAIYRRFSHIIHVTKDLRKAPTIDGTREPAIYTY